MSRLGREAEIHSADAARARGIDVQEQISFKNESVRARADQAYFEDGRLKVVEVKTGGGDLTQNQKQVYQEIESGNATITRGSGNRLFGRGGAPDSIKADVYVEHFPDPSDLAKSTTYTLSEWTGRR